MVICSSPTPGAACPSASCASFTASVPLRRAISAKMTPVWLTNFSSTLSIGLRPHDVGDDARGELGHVLERLGSEVSERHLHVHHVDFRIRANARRSDRIGLDHAHVQAPAGSRR